MFGEKSVSRLPHLVAFKKTVQGDDAALLGGYIAYTMMTLLPGQDLLDLRFWSMAENERELIRAAFLDLLKYVLG